MFFQNQHNYFIRKPPAIASTRGNTMSLLDLLFIKNDLDIIKQFDGSWDLLDQSNIDVFSKQIENLGILPCQNFIDILKKTFTKEEEFGLLNRLDTDTSGMLYFAKDKEVYGARKGRQKESKIQKHYLAKTEGIIKQQNINTPLAHHTNGKRMLVVDDVLLSSKKKQKIKGKNLEATTTILGDVGEFTHIMIHKGRRHQIRAHLSYIGHPIVGEKLYSDSQISPLQLYSIGCKTNL